MMTVAAEELEITRYAYYVFASRGDQNEDRAVVRCELRGTASLAYLYFSTGPLALQQTVKSLDGKDYYVYYRHSDLPLVLDMLRNEKPVTLVFVETEPGGPNNSRISTWPEPVGAGDESAHQGSGYMPA